MDSMTRREEGFERAYSHQAEIRFRTRTRRNRKLGVWAGGLLGISGAALQDYAAGLVERGFIVADDEVLAHEIAETLKEKDISLHRVRRRIQEFDAEALAEIEAGR